MLKVFHFNFFNESSIANLYFKYQRVTDICNADIFILAGGSDVNPRVYGETLSTEAAKFGGYFFNVRDDKEINALHIALKKGVKILAVCRGHQLVNAVMGGKLTQHISPAHPHFHPLSNGMYVNSLHHQGVKIAGTSLEIVATFEKEIEITRNKQILSMQFHPEMMQEKVSHSMVYDWVGGKHENYFRD